MKNQEKFMLVILEKYIKQFFLYLKDIESHQRIKEHEIIRKEVDLDERI